MEGKTTNIQMGKVNWVKKLWPLETGLRLSKTFEVAQALPEEGLEIFISAEDDFLYGFGILFLVFSVNNGQSFFTVASEIL